MPIKLQPVILSGGSGTRLWPQSREHHPKQLLPLMGEETMLQATARRVEGFTAAQSLPPLVVSNNEYRFIIAEQLRQLGQDHAHVLIEPVGRNTAPALTLAALHTAEEDPILLVMPADHVIGDLAAFHRAIEAGLPSAEEGMIVTFGIVPAAPETGYGYLRVSKDGALRDLEEFVEKPDAATAQSYVDSGNYLWNSGLFMLRASTWLKALRKLQPEMYDAVEKAYTDGEVQGPFTVVQAEAFAASPSDSIDYAVMEKLGETDIKTKVVPLSCGWSDVGAWDAFWEASAKDAQGNVTRGDVVLESATDCVVLSTDRLVACVGVSNVVVVETPDAVLVLDKRQAQLVKPIVDRLKKAQRPEARAHRRVYRPWGMYDSIDMGERFQVKRIVVEPGGTLSLQMHHHRAEHWVVVRGTAEVERGEDTFLLTENQSTYIPHGVRHRLRNPGKIPLEMIEIQSGSYLGEDDIVRFSDTYGRN